MIQEFGGDFLQWLRGFYYVATTGSVSKASKSMGRNQPAISHQIKCLEEELKVTLFDRSKGKMALTYEGHELLEKAISIFEIVKEVRAEIGRDNMDICGAISIATTHAINLYYLPGYIVPFQRKHKGVFFEIKGGPLQTIMENVEAADVDFGVASFIEVPDFVTYDELFKTRLVLIAPRYDVFEIGTQLTIEKLKTLPILAPPPSSTIYTLMKNLARTENFDWNVVQTINTFVLVKRYVELGYGVGIVDEYAVNEDRDTISVYPLDEFFKPRSYGVVARKRKYMSPQAKSFIKNLKMASIDFDYS
jgi:DNA-binding transcriptional LysR family regulator